MALKVKIGADAKSFFREMDRVDKRGATMGEKMKAAGKAAAIGIGAIAVAATAAAVSVGALALKMVKIGEDANTADDRIRNTVKNMLDLGESSEKVSQRIIKFARAQSMLTGIDNKVIKLAQAKLLTFAEVAASSDKMGGMFDRATMAAINLEKQGFGSATDNATQLGKALGNPIRGLGALTKSGMEFTALEREKIVTLAESNKMLEAQEILMLAIERQSIRAAEKTANGTDKIRNAISLVIEDAAKPMARAFEGISETVLAMEPAITKSMEKLAPKIAAFANYLGSSISEALQGNISHIMTLFEIIGEVSAKAFMKGFEHGSRQLGAFLIGRLDNDVNSFRTMLNQQTGLDVPMVDRAGGIKSAADYLLKEDINLLVTDALNQFSVAQARARRDMLMRQASQYGEFNFDRISVSPSSKDPLDAILREIQGLNRSLSNFPN